MGWGVFGDGEEAWLDLEKVYDAAAAAGKLPIRCVQLVYLKINMLLVAVGACL
jgi:hypothetical protein